MYLARFSYDVLPVNRDRAIDFIRGEVAAAGQNGLSARLLVPLSRGKACPALQFEIELTSLDQLETFRRQGQSSQGQSSQGQSSTKDAGEWMRAFSEILTAPPIVEILRVEP